MNENFGWQEWYKALLALVIWREARGEGLLGMASVACVIRNRVMAKHIPDTWDDVIEKKWQFSSMTAPGDSQLIEWPNSPDQSFVTAMRIADMVVDGSYTDVTLGSTLYYNPVGIVSNVGIQLPVGYYRFPKTWDKSKVQFVKQIGNHLFFKQL